MLLFTPPVSIAQEAVTTLAGSLLTSGSQDGPVSLALFSDPTGIAIDAAGNIYIADNQNHAVRKLSTAGNVTTLAGHLGKFGAADGIGTNAYFNSPSGIVLAPNGLLYVTDTGNNTIRCITTNGVVTTVAGLAGQAGAINGNSGQAEFNSPLGIAADSSGTLYVADAGNHQIRKIIAGGVTNLAGLAGVWGSTNGSGDAALFNGPVGLALDSEGNVFVSDSNNHTIRKITPSGTATTFAGVAGLDGTNDGVGSLARFCKPAEMVIDRANNIFVVDSFSHTIRKITPGAAVTTVAGSAGNSGATNGFGTQARFFNPYGIAIDHNGNLRVSDTYNEIIRFVYQPISVSLGRNPAGNGFVIQWQAVSNDTYQVQYCDSNISTNWQNLGQPVTPQTSPGTFTDSSLNSSSQRLYRVKLLP